MPGYIHSGCAHFEDVIRRRNGRFPGDILVIGSGDGLEASYFHHRGLNVTAIDTFEPEHVPEGVTFVRAAGEALPFEDRAFDYVFCFHVLEHVHDAHRVVSEAARVLRPGGLFYVGVPNRHRAMSLIGSGGIPMRRKLKDNLIEWVDRFWGRFHNKYGAHAGFSDRELRELLHGSFTVEKLTDDYMAFKYPRLRRALPALRPLFPAVYAVGERN